GHTRRGSLRYLRYETIPSADKVLSLDEGAKGYAGNCRGTWGRAGGPAELSYLWPIAAAMKIPNADF
ncbi:hypothetical protein K443DRAFT_191420, partial [Laccaria amethystina LaAM-08-1]